MNDVTPVEFVQRQTETTTEQEMENLLYTLSHDMRAPFVTLRGFVDELTMLTDDLSQQLEEVSPKLEVDQQQQIQETLAEIPEIKQYINASVQQLDHYLHDLLTLSRLGRKHLSSNTVHLTDVVNESVQRVTEQIDISYSQITVDTLLDCVGDHDALVQIIQHVLDNAVRYTHPDQDAQVHISGVHDSDCVRITIQDHGRGLSQENVKLVFDPFFRVGWPGTEGRGMGLTYARKLVRMQGGAIGCESSEGVGTKFHIWLPTSGVYPDTTIHEEN